MSWFSNIKHDNAEYVKNNLHKYKCIYRKRNILGSSIKKGLAGIHVACMFNSIKCLEVLYEAEKLLNTNNKHNIKLKNKETIVYYDSAL